MLSAADATPLEAAHVWFKGSDIGAVTNKDGFFMIRSPKPQSRLVVSIVGYNRKIMKLDHARDQMLEVFLSERIENFDDIYLFPGENPAYEILRRVDANRERNNPELISNIVFHKQKTTNLDLTNIKQKAYQRKLFSEIMKGAVSKEDSLYILPILRYNELTANTIYPESANIESLRDEKNAVEILTTEHWDAFLQTYTPDVNFYKPYVTFLNKAVLSPIASQGRTFYKYYLVDSVLTESTKCYIINFSPKVGSLPLLKGTMSVDAETYALTHVDAALASSANINFVNDFHIVHNFENFPISSNSSDLDSLGLVSTFDTINNHRFYSSTSHSVGLKMNIVPDKNNVFWGAMLSEKTEYTNVSLIDSGITYLPRSQYITQEDTSALRDVWNKIDTINQSHLKRLVEWGIDIGINQYLHLWKIDIGPVLNLFHYNELEGASPRLTMRSGESFAKNFTFGGYLGYGFKDKQYKYGAEMRWRFGENKNHTFAGFYDRKTVNYGYDEFYIFNEDKVEDNDHLVNSLFDLVFPSEENKTPHIGLRNQVKLQYKYEKQGFRFMSDAFASQTFSNEYMPFVSNGLPLESYKQISLRLGFRTSWRERSLDYFFNRFYLGSDRPVFNSVVEAGLVQVDQYIHPYAKLTLSLRHEVSFVLGKFVYDVEVAGIAGKVPYPTLVIPRGGSSIYYSKHKYVLMNSFEFLTDIFVGARLQYQTPGFIFGYIPVVKKLGIRENLIFNIAYGAFLQKHNEVLAIPAQSKTFGSMPYMECGIGFSNILRLFTIESIWRLTYRNTPEATNWAIRFRLDLDF